MAFTIPKGTKDVAPAESYKWHYVEDKIRETAREYGLLEIRTPVFEHTELFLRGVGETTDIVNKEMYTFLDKGGRSITLKPEGTAGAARSFVENGLGELPQPTKMFYLTPVFRYEKPQAGRLREHHQFGIEIFGSEGAFADAEVISVAGSLFRKLGITELELQINSIGCPECRKEYNRVLTEYLSARIDGMCDLCRDRLKKNPLRILDCKEERCAQINKDAPSVLDTLCGGCREHFERVKEILDSLGVKYKVNPRLVRGLDYYTRTVFEFISTNIGAQGTVCGGGRYDRLVEEVGGKPTPGAGFGMGLERLILVLENLGLSTGMPEIPKIYIAPASPDEAIEAYKITAALRKAGITADTDLMGRSLKAQMKYAGKQGYPFAAVIGGEELLSGKMRLRDMLGGGEKEVELSNLAEELRKN